MYDRERKKPVEIFASRKFSTKWHHYQQQQWWRRRRRQQRQERKKYNNGSEMFEKWQFNENLFSYVQLWDVCMYVYEPAREHIYKIVLMPVISLSLALFHFGSGLFVIFILRVLRTQYNNSCDANVASFRPDYNGNSGSGNSSR